MIAIEEVSMIPQSCLLPNSSVSESSFPDQQIHLAVMNAESDDCNWTSCFTLDPL